jgi:hypothetical protein
MTIPRNSGGHAPIWAAQASAQPLVQVLVPAQHPFIGQQAHPRRERPGHLSPLLGAQALLRRQHRPDRLAGRREHRGHPVTHRGEHHPVMRFDRPPHDRVMPRQRVPHLLRMRLPPARGTLQVGEQERHRPGRQLRLPGLARPGRRRMRRPGACRRVLEALAQKNGKVVGQEPFEFPWRGEGPVRRGAFRADTVDHRLQPWLLVWGRTLEIQQHRLADG